MADLPLSSWLLMKMAMAVVVVLSVGVARAAHRAHFAPSQVRNLAFGLGIVLSLWLTLTGVLAWNGVFSEWADRPPRLPFLPLTAILTYVLISSTTTFKKLLAVVPLWQPVAFESFRNVVEFILWRLHEEGNAPLQVTFAGGNYDGLVAVTAPVIALGVGLGFFGKRVLIAWNLFGIAMLITAIRASVTITPGPFYHEVPGQEPFTAIATWPVVWIPALFAPTAMFMHILSLRQAIGLRSLDRSNETVFLATLTK